MNRRLKVAWKITGPVGMVVFVARNSFSVICNLRDKLPIQGTLGRCFVLDKEE